MLGRIILSAAASFGTLCLVKGSAWAENAIVEEILSWNLIGTEIPFAVVVVFFVIYRITFVFTHKRRF